MQKKKQDQREGMEEKTVSNPAADDSQNQNHNTKKVSLGPNTKR